MTYENLWAGWRSAYVSMVAEGGELHPVEQLGDEPGPSGESEAACVFCRILASGASHEDRNLLWQGDLTAALLNAYPYTTGHLVVMPLRHVADLTDLTTDESVELWSAVTAATTALRSAYAPDGLNVGVNLGRAAGAGIPGHVHVHVLPRWNGDTNFLTATANIRVLPEALSDTWAKVSKAWPS